MSCDELEFEHLYGLICSKNDERKTNKKNQTNFNSYIIKALNRWGKRPELSPAEKLKALMYRKDGK